MVVNLIRTSRLAIGVLLVLAGSCSFTLAMDTDGDGLLDLLDASRYDPMTVGAVVMSGQGIEDLDGASAYGDEVTEIHLGANLVQSIDVGDFTGSSATVIQLWNNQISNIEPYAFEGVTLRDLNLNGNPYSDLHLEGGIYERLFHLGIDRFRVKKLFLDDAQISEFSFDEVTRETTEITDLSMVNMTFLGDAPESVSTLLSHSFLDRVTVDEGLLEQYRDDFDSFAALDDNILTIVRPLDCNVNGLVEFTDLNCVENAMARDATLSELNLLRGDLDGDREVGFADFLILARGFGAPSATYLEGNLDLVGTVEFSDFLIMAANFGSQASSMDRLLSASAEPIPEPTGIGFVGAVIYAWFCLGMFRRKRS